jgi:hypothetical protein
MNVISTRIPLKCQVRWGASSPVCRTHVTNTESSANGPTHGMFVVFDVEDGSRWCTTSEIVPFRTWKKNNRCCVTVVTQSLRQWLRGELLFFFFWKVGTRLQCTLVGAFNSCLLYFVIFCGVSFEISCRDFCRNLWFMFSLFAKKSN